LAMMRLGSHDGSRSQQYLDSDFPLSLCWVLVGGAVEAQRTVREDATVPERPETVSSHHAGRKLTCRHVSPETTIGWPDSPMKVVLTETSHSWSPSGLRLARTHASSSAVENFTRQTGSSSSTGSCMALAALLPELRETPTLVWSVNGGNPLAQPQMSRICLWLPVFADSS
jgi:hypothetical protein